MVSRRTYLLIPHILHVILLILTKGLTKYPLKATVGPDGVSRASADQPARSWGNFA
jgi:hypothetical protein